jgi:aminopeptidase YwaD
MKLFYARLLFGLLPFLLAQSLRAQFLQSDSDDRLKQWVEYLASDALEGRLTGSQGEKMAFDFLSEKFQEWTLSPAQGDKFTQAFEFTWEILPSPEATIEWEANGDRTALNAYPISGCGEALLPGTEFLNLGFGIEDTANGHSDYPAVSDLGGKVVLIEAGTPKSDNPHADFSRWTLLERARLAAQRGAGAVLFYGGTPDDSPSKTIDPHIHAMPIPVWYCLDALPQSNEPALIWINSSLNRIKKTGHNVVADLIRNKNQPTLIVGAHYDHLGWGERGSLYRGEKAIHNGADDNASGTALMLELARFLAQTKDKRFLRFNYRFIGFSGEELGLLGSKAFVEGPAFQREGLLTMFNMDMVGRLDLQEKTLQIHGAGTSPRWATLLDSLKPIGLKIKTSESGIGPSDHTSFYLQDLPVLHFFSGTHDDYHKPSDDPHTLNYRGMTDIGNYMLRIIAHVPDVLPFSKTKAPEQGKSKFKVTLGVVPDYGWEKKGMRISGVTEGKPAALAGLQKNDVVLQLGDHPVDDIYGYMAALGKFKKGDQTTVRILREEKPLTFKITFE